MADRWNVRERLQTVRGRLRDYEGRLKELDARLTVVRSQAERATGAAKVRLRRAERDLRATMQTTLGRLDGVLETLEPRVRRALDQTKLVARGVRAGVKAGAVKYRTAAKPK